MEVVISNMIQITEPTSEILSWCHNNLILVNPEYERKMRMGYWIGNTPKTINLYSRVGNALYLPFGTLRSIWSMIKPYEPIAAFPEPVNVDYGNVEIPLYEYQEEAVNRLHVARYGILQSPAGSGKTQIGIALIKRYKRRALWLTHTADLLKQSKDRAEQYMDKNLMGTITEGKVNIGTGITFATVQTMSRLDLNQYRDVWDVIIVDECHRAAGSPTQVTQFSKVLNALNARHKYGLSATVHRSDGLIAATYALLGGIVHNVPADAVASNIMNVGIKPKLTHVPLTEQCLNSDGTLCYAGMITYLSEHPERNQQIVEDIVKNKRHPCLILSDRLEHLAILMDMLPESMRSKAAMISGKMTSKVEKARRNEILEEMRNGELQYLFATYQLAKEGLDIPRLERLFMATPIKDYAVVVQALGRIARACPDKRFPIAYDYIDAINYCRRAYKSRCSHYKKINAYFAGE